MLQTCITASGSSEFTWNMGAFTTLATSINKQNNHNKKTAKSEILFTLKQLPITEVSQF